MMTVQEIAAECRNLSNIGLRQVFDTFLANRHVWASESRPFAELAGLAPYRWSTEEILDFAMAVLADEIDLREFAPAIRTQEEQLLGWLGKKVTSLSSDERKDFGLRAVCYVSGVFVPAMAALRQFEMALPAVMRLVHRITGRSFRAVLGGASEGIPLPPAASNDEVDPQLVYRFLLLGPVITSVTLCFPSDPT